MVITWSVHFNRVFSIHPEKRIEVSTFLGIFGAMGKNWGEKKGQRTMYRLAPSLGRVQTALPNCYGGDHQGSHERARRRQRERARSEESSPMMWFYDKFRRRMTEGR